MDPSAFDALPRAYRIGLRLHALGADDELIAECLDIDTDGVMTLLNIGVQKLEHTKPCLDQGVPPEGDSED